MFRVWSFFLLFVSFGFSQKYTLSGYVKDQATGESLIGAQIIVPELKTGVFSNNYGYYALTLPQGKYTIVIRYLGYTEDTFQVNLQKNIKKNISLSKKGVKLKEVTITDNKARENVESSNLGVMDIKVEQVKTMPVLLGEVDIVKVMQLLPGVQSTGDGQAGFLVRGGRFDQNLVLLDEAIVYNASHFVGFFSVFNPEAIKTFKILKGIIPAQYGGRLSSVVDIRMKEGNMKKYQFSGGMGSITSRLTAEGPIIKDKSAFLLAGRYSYAGLMLKLIPNEAVRRNSLYFYDLNAKVNYIFSDKDRIFISAYNGKDVFDFGSNRLKWFWGNTTVSGRWNHIFREKLFSNTTLTYSNYTYAFNFSSIEEFEYVSGLKDYSFKNDWDYFLSSQLHLKFGGQSIYHIFSPGKFTPLQDSSSFNPIEVEKRYALENAVYVNLKHSVNEVLEMQYGLRFGYFMLLGPLNLFQYDSPRDPFPSDTVFIEKGKIVKDYSGLEPRFSFRYKLNENSSVKGGYARTFQYVQVATYSSVGTPADFWIPSSRNIPPQRGDQVSLGYFRNFADNKIEASVEAYYKVMKNQIDFRPGANVYGDPTFEKDILVGKGNSKGIEWMIKKNKGTWNGWIAYTLSWTFWQIPGINDNEPYPAFTDRRHDISVIINKKLFTRWDVTATWVYITGRPISLPLGKYEVNGTVVKVYGRRNAYRLPDYHRMDLSVNYKLVNPKKNKKKDWTLNFSVYNVYNRRNAWSLIMETDEETGEEKIQKIYLFGIVPSVSVNFKF